MTKTPSYKVLGQLCPTDSALHDLYTVPASTQTVVSTVIANNIGGNTDTFAISIAVGGAVDSDEQYLYGSMTQGLMLDSQDTFAATIGITLAAGDVVRVRSDTGSSETTFQLFGSEIS